MRDCIRVRHPLHPEAYFEISGAQAELYGQLIAGPVVSNSERWRVLYRTLRDQDVPIEKAHMPYLPPIYFLPKDSLRAYEAYRKAFPQLNENQTRAIFGIRRKRWWLPKEKQGDV